MGIDEDCQGTEHLLVSSDPGLCNLSYKSIKGKLCALKLGIKMILYMLEKRILLKQQIVFIFSVLYSCMLPMDYV